MTRCRFCLEELPDSGQLWCEGAVECNWRCRIRLGCGRKVANMERARERWRYPESQGGKRKAS
jgi:hypothetical protein